MIEVDSTGSRDGWCNCCQKEKNTKRIRFMNAYRQGMSVVLCDDCQRELIRLLSEQFNSEG